jgi:glycosyltransferase involved in cell wall biosynthesis
MLSLVIPIYRSAENIPDLIRELDALNSELKRELEIVFVVDGSPDESEWLLRDLLPSCGFASRLVVLSRNFGAFSAIAAGLKVGRGDFFAVMAADLQEPPQLIPKFYEKLSGTDLRERPDIVFGTRSERQDPVLSRLFSNTFWSLYRFFVNADIPEGGVDIFACNRKVRDQVIALTERGSSLIGLLFWVGFKRSFVPYVRQERVRGKSSWSLRKKWNYFLDSFFSFTNLPIRLLTNVGIFGLALSVSMGIMVTFSKIFGLLTVPGYAATILTVLFFGGLNSLGLGIIGEYVWRTFQNTQSRPNFIVRESVEFNTARSEKGGSRKVVEIPQ